MGHRDSALNVVVGPVHKMISIFLLESISC